MVVTILRVIPILYQLGLAILGSTAITVMRLREYLLSRRRPRENAAASEAFKSVLFVIPAHDEDTIIRQTIEAIHDVAPTAKVYDVVVIADRCTDQTAYEAVKAGAYVLCRDSGPSGKQHALTWAFESLQKAGDLDIYDLVCILDADNRLAPGALDSAVRYLGVADAVQMRVAPLNSTSSMQAAWYGLCASWAAGVESARQLLGLQTILAGTGMVFKSSLLQEVPFDCSTVIEDWEYTCHLTAAGRQVAYAADAITFNEAPDRWLNGYRQRLRWTRGGWQVLLKCFWPVLLRRPEMALWLLTPVYNIIAASYCMVALLTPGNSLLVMVLQSSLLFVLPAMIQGSFALLGGIGYVPVSWVMAFSIAWRGLFSAHNFAWYRTVHGEGRR